MEAEFNLKLILKALKKNLIWIIAITLFCTTLLGVVTFFIPPTYSSKATYLSTNYKSDDEFTQSALITAQQQLVKDYIEIIKSKTMLEVVSAKLKEQNIEYTHTELASMISGKQVEDTSAFTITVNCDDRDHALIITQTLSSVVAGVIDGVQKRENTVAVLDEGTEPTQTSPSLIKNLIFGFLVGFLGSTAVFGLIAFYDRTLHTEDDLKKRFNIPVIGVIPEWRS